ncbi:MAG: DoxX family protein [Bacteroidota bacterium]
MDNAILETLNMDGAKLLQVLITLFVAILFLQSGIDKVINWKGEKAYYADHFKKTFLKDLVPMLMPVITISELLAGICCGIGLFTLLFNDNVNLGFLGMLLAALSIIQLFFGQRIAKDFGGAATLVPYFLLTIAGLYVYMI